MYVTIENIWRLNYTFQNASAQLSIEKKNGIAAFLLKVSFIEITRLPFVDDYFDENCE